MEARKDAADHEVAESSKDESPKKESQGTNPKRQRRGDGSIGDISFDLEFGPSAFGALERKATAVPAGSDLSSSVKKIVLASYPAARNMKGQRDAVPVTQMLTNIYCRGLFTFGNEHSAVNKEIIPSMRHIFGEISKLEATNERRTSIVKLLAEACLDCQQVQARTIQKVFGDLTAQSLTFEQQLKYTLLGQKEAALNVLITNSHGGPGGFGKPMEGSTPNCDLDHTRVPPCQQRAHLLSGYIHLLGESCGFDGVTAARDDRFLSDVLPVIHNAHSPRHIASGNSTLDTSTTTKLIAMLKTSMSVGEWLSALIADINNQTESAERLIDRSCIFDWVTKNMEGDFKFKVFYDSERAEEYKHLDPNKPTEANEYQPFLSPSILVDMLMKAGMLVKAESVS